MTVLKAYEEIQSVFPKIGQVQILEELSNSQMSLSEETKILEAFGQLATPTTVTGWALPSDFISLLDILLYDSDDEPLYMGVLGYDYEITNGKLYIFSKSSTPITGLAVETAYIHYTKRATPITSTTDTFSLNTEFHSGITAGAYHKLFMKYPVEQVINGNIVLARDLRTAQAFEREYDKTRLKIKRNRYKDERHKGAIYYPHAGAFELPKRNRDTISSSVTIGSIASIYTKYARWTLTYPSTVTEVVTPTGFTGTITASIASNQLTISSTASDFSNIIDFNTNQDDVIINSFGSTSWIFDLPVGDWGVLRFEIME